jgi:protocatechuate 3,4-dioxygenase beta subunit
MMRQVIALFDEYQSKENAKHVLRSMKENARQGFWNGARPPFGYRTVEVEKRGARVKKRLEIDPVEAEQVRLIFKLLQGGYDGQGPKGLKAIATWLSEQGYRTRQGGLWGIGALHQLVTNPVYGGRWRFNKVEARTGKRKSDAEHIYADAPAIIEPAAFEAVQQVLKKRNPRIEAPRAVTGPILLTGLAFCSLCNGAMTLRTGTSKSGKTHRYYTCSTCARKGKAACAGRTVQMDRLDGIVTEALADKLLSGERLWDLLSALASRRAERAAAVDARLASLESEAETASDKLRRLYRMVEDGVAEMDDLLKDRITTLKADRDRAKEALSRAQFGVRAKAEVSPEAAARFGVLMRARVLEGDTPARKAWIGAIIDRIEVDQGTVRIMGRKDVLEQAVAAGGQITPGVRTCVPRWRAMRAFVLSAIVLATAALPASALDPTPPQTEGPYYPAKRPADTDNDLTRIGNGPQAKGEVLVLEGRVLDTSGAPIEGARVEIWQTDHQGIYMHPGDGRTAKRDMAFQFYGETRSAAGGAFTFRTILPAAYSGRPRHIHAKVTPPGGPTLTTQFYFKGDKDLDRDGIVRGVGKGLANVTLAPEKRADGVSVAAVTVVLARGKGR